MVATRIPRRPHPRVDQLLLDTAVEVPASAGLGTAVEELVLQAAVLAALDTAAAAQVSPVVQAEQEREVLAMARKRHHRNVRQAAAI